MTSGSGCEACGGCDAWGGCDHADQSRLPPSAAATTASASSTPHHIAPARSRYSATSPARSPPRPAWRAARRRRRPPPPRCWSTRPAGPRAPTLERDAHQHRRGQRAEGEGEDACSLRGAGSAGAVDRLGDDRGRHEGDERHEESEQRAQPPEPLSVGDGPVRHRVEGWHVDRHRPRSYVGPAATVGPCSAPHRARPAAAA